MYVLCADIPEEQFLLCCCREARMQHPGTRCSGNNLSNHKCGLRLGFTSGVLNYFYLNIL
jgi:hypothetical protein